MHSVHVECSALRCDQLLMVCPDPLHAPCCVAAAGLLQASMTQLLLYYTRMLELLKKQGPEGTALAREVVNIPAIMYEIKRITKA
jgi:hypothetical protein